MSTVPDLIPFEDFEHRVPGLSRPALNRLAREGRAPTPVRWGARGSRLLWRREEIDRWIEARLARPARGV